MIKHTGKRLDTHPEDYVVFDLETTGLSPERDEIIEISAIRVRKGQMTDQFSTLVNPGRPIPFAASNVNGITDAMVKDAPSLHTALNDFLLFAGKDILVGHNIHTFDMRFLYNSADRELNQTIENNYVDTLYLAKNCLPLLPRHRLTDIAAYFHIETEGAHRALNDCIMNQKCFEKLGRLLTEQKNKCNSNQTGPLCPKCGSMLIRRNGRYGTFWGCSGFPVCRYTQNT